MTATAARGSLRVSYNNMRISWHHSQLSQIGQTCCTKRLNRGKDHHHPFWHFVSHWRRYGANLAQQLINGTYRFQPLVGSVGDYAIEPRWCFIDRWALKCIYQIIKPTIKRIISKHCLHIRGPSGVIKGHSWLQEVLQHHRFRYVLRLDIKSYYASINHQILYQQLEARYDDPRLLNYFKLIVEYTIDRFGQIIHAEKGIPRQSSLSNFFAAVYLSPLDQAFENRPGTFYLRYNDDILILCTNKKQFLKAKRTVYQVLDQLKLTLSKRKSRMGPLDKGFHYLGLNYSPQVVPDPVSRNQDDDRQIRWQVSLHQRTCHRAIDKLLSQLIVEGMDACGLKRLGVSDEVWHQCRGPIRLPCRDPTMRMYLHQLYKRQPKLRPALQVFLHLRFEEISSPAQVYVHRWSSWWSRTPGINTLESEVACGIVLAKVEPSLAPIYADAIVTT